MPQKIYARFNCFDIKQSIGQINKTCTKLDPQSLYGTCRVNQTKVTGPYLRCGRMKCFIVISLLKQALFQMILIDARIKINIFVEMTGFMEIP